MCEGGSGLLGGEVMRRESWRVERRDSVEHLARGVGSGYIWWVAGMGSGWSG